MKAVIIVAGTVLFLSACSHGGPYVTNISSDGQGGLTIEKCMLKYNGWTGGMENENCNSTNIKVVAPSSSK